METLICNRNHTHSNPPTLPICMYNMEVHYILVIFWVPLEPEIYYIPVLRSVDNSTAPQLFSPCTLPELTNQSPLFNGSSTSVAGTVTVSSPIVGHALAGPMSPSQANEFYREWRSPSQSQERKETSIVKRSDPERGLERVGRYIHMTLYYA